MDILSLSVAVINAHNTNNADLFAIKCSQLEDAVMNKDFISIFETEHCYVIGRALYCCITYNNRYNTFINEVDILKRMFLCLTKAMFENGEQRIRSAKLLFIALYRNRGLFNQLWENEKVTPSSIQNEYTLLKIEDLLKGVISDINWCLLDADEEIWYNRANEDYSHRFSKITMNDLEEGEEYLNSCYELFYNSINL